MFNAFILLGIGVLGVVAVWLVIDMIIHTYSLIRTWMDYKRYRQ